MSETSRVEKIPLRDHEFTRKIRAEGMTNLDRCYQCSACSDGCPVAYAMDYYPHQLIYMVKLGLKEKVLESKTIWICVSCETCATRCPNGIEIVRLMDVLRKESLKGGFKSPVNKIPKFHQVFIKEIQKKGRVDEAGLLLNYELKTGDFLSLKKIREEGSLGLKMFRKGRLKLPSIKTKKIQGQKEVEEIFKKVLSHK
ncbi:MAG: 4Fe-4S dicluster domain-containing protein [Deltaproteobacteria bacterium]|nr:4Fe-4S dicluster domain-containing protein [Deltaproteobacteria bacterium]